MAVDEQEIRSGTVEELAETVSDAEKREAVHNVRSAGDALFTWDYERSREALSKLYEKAKTSMWNVSTDIDWDIDVDPWKIARDPNNPLNTTMALERAGTPFEKLSEDEWFDLGAAQQSWVLSQFMHGEQGALICTAQIVETVPWIDAKYYASTQVMDEARHVEVYAKYLDTKLDGYYPINAHLRMLLDDIVNDSRWDMTYLGMQIMVEGLALAAFGFMYQLTEEPLLKQLLRYVMSDEARHVAFGVLSLKEYYEGLTDAEMLERQEFAFEAAVRMRDRFLQQEVWERLGVDVRRMVHLQLTHETNKNDDPFQQLLFSKIVPNCKKLGLLDRNDGWLRKKFGEINVIQFEDWRDTGEEYELLDELGKDRAAAAESA